MSNKDEGDTALLMKTVEEQTKVHNEPQIVEKFGDELLESAKSMTWDECPECSQERMEERVRKLLKAAEASGKNVRVEVIDQKLCFVRYSHVQLKLIDGKKYTKPLWQRESIGRRFFTKEEYEEAWLKAEVLEPVVSRTINEITDKKLIGPWKQRVQDLELRICFENLFDSSGRGDSVVCKHHPTTVFAVEGESTNPTIEEMRSKMKRAAHDVSGHYRRLTDGKEIWVRSHQRNKHH